MRIKKRLLDGLNWARSRFSENSAVLLYHRVAPRQRDHFGLCVTPDNFEQQMASVSGLGHPIALGDLIDQNRNGTLRANSIAITFDDGYLDVLQNAVPILEKYNLPATIFIVTGNLGQAFWWDRLTDLVVQSNNLPETIDFGSITFPTAGHSRDRLLKMIYPTARRLSPRQRDAELASLARSIGHSTELQQERAMDETELKSLAAHPLITLGAHTATHSQLAALSAADQQDEIASSLQKLESVIGRPVTTFSYPFGIKSRDYTTATMDAAKRAGLGHAIAADLNVVTQKAEDFAIPRLWIHDWDGPRFRKNINRWL